MIKNYLTGIFIFLLSSTVMAQQNKVNNAYHAGEKLTYRVYYSSPIGDFTAGTAIMQAEEIIRGNTEMFHLIGTGSTKGFFDWFFKVRDRFDSYVAKQSLLPEKFIRHTNEGTFHFEDEVNFDRKSNLAYSSRDTTPIQADIHDIISSVYYLRTLSLDAFDEDSLYYISFFLDDSVYHSVLKFVMKGKVETRWGKIPCIKVAPSLVTGSVFSDKYGMSVWVTDDDNKIPIFAESKIIVGSVKMELIEYEGLKNPFIEAFNKKIGE
jgi:hypothetical protein